jgi:predicted outer membrane lipoprotein
MLSEGTFVAGVITMLGFILAAAFSIVAAIGELGNKISRKLDEIKDEL